MRRSFPSMGQQTGGFRAQSGARVRCNQRGHGADDCRLQSLCAQFSCDDCGSDPSERGQPLTRQAVDYLIAAGAERAGLPRVHPHTLRHSCGFVRGRRTTETPHPGSARRPRARRPWSRVSPSGRSRTPYAFRADGSVVARSFRALRGASANATFWILAGTFFICGLSTSGLVQNHFIPLCHDFGMDAVAASGVLALMGACDFVGTIGSGWLSDRVDNRWLLFWYYGLRGISLFLLPYSTFSFYGLSLFAVFYGLDWTATVPPTVKLTGQTFGREQGPLLFGRIFTAHQLGSAGATYGAGASRDALASYLPAFSSAGVACMLAALAVLAVRRRASHQASPAAAV